MNKPHILITNDDGIYAEGIQSLTRVLHEQYGKNYKISVIAPDRERSAVGHGITMHKPLRVEEIDFINIPGLCGLAVNGTPSDCVKLAVEAILDNKPDLVISGINRGSNLGTDVLYSGTVSAAVEGLLMDINSIAISLTGRGDSNNFLYAARFISDFIPEFMAIKQKQPLLVNINVPRNTDRIKGVKVTSLGVRRYKNAFEQRVDPRGMHYYWLAGDLVDDDEIENAADTDTRAIKEGYISITPVHFQLTNRDAIPGLKEIIELMKSS